MSNQHYIGRTSSGKYHRAYNANVVRCNHSGQIRSGYNRPATETEIASADASSFCKRCFPNGKPLTQEVGA
jgi:hypothetical protein